MSDGIEENKTDGGGLTRQWGGPVRTVAATTAGAGVGVIGAIAGITATAVVLEVALPVTLCVWAGGITCGAIGLALGIKEKATNGKDERREHASEG